MAERPFEIPDIGAPVADTHAHLDMLEDPGAALARAALAGVDFVITVVDPTEEPEVTFGRLPAWIEEARALIASEAGDPATPPEVRIILGVHPHNAKDFGEATAEQMRELSGDRAVTGIGEIGLDYHYDHSPRDVQLRVFARQLALAVELDLPAVVHLREAHEDGERVMRDVGLPPRGCVLHCFTGERTLLRRFLDLGCFVSFAGPVTFKKTDDIREAAAIAPLDRILVETDCPFMAPEPYRGRKNEPALAVFNAIRIADTKGMTPAQFARVASENARLLFGGPR